MTLANILNDKLAGWQPQERAPLCAAAESGWTANLSADRNDALSTLVWDLTLQNAAGQTDASPRAWAESICQRVTSLLGPLALHEVDEGRHEALLRSQQPSGRNGSILYHEVHLRGTQQATVRRYQASHADKSPRQQTAYALTHEALAKLVEDITA